MPRIEYFALAESFAVDRETGAVSLFNILSTVRGPQMPFAIPRMVVAAFWLCDVEEVAVEKEHSVSVRFHIPGRSEPLVEYGHLTTSARSMLSIFEVFGASFDRTGELVAEIALDERVCETHRVLIEEIPGE